MKHGIAPASVVSPMRSHGQNSTADETGPECAQAESWRRAEILERFTMPAPVAAPGVRGAQATTAAQPEGISGLPDELWLAVLTRLDDASLGAFSRTCSAAARLGQDMALHQPRCHGQTLRRLGLRSPKHAPVRSPQAVLGEAATEQTWDWLAIRRLDCAVRARFLHTWGNAAPGGADGADGTGGASGYAFLQPYRYQWSLDAFRDWVALSLSTQRPTDLLAKGLTLRLGLRLELEGVSSANGPSPSERSALAMAKLSALRDAGASLVGELRTSRDTPDARSNHLLPVLCNDEAGRLGIAGTSLQKLFDVFGVPPHDSINVTDAYGQTALARAVAGIGGRRIDTVRVLLEAGADANQGDPHGVTPLMHALAPRQSGADVIRSWEVAALLCRHGADLYARDADGQSVANWAQLPMATLQQRLKTEAPASPDATAHEPAGDDINWLWWGACTLVGGLWWLHMHRRQ